MPSAFADSASTGAPSFAVIVSRKQRQMRARPLSNASRYTYHVELEPVFKITRFKSNDSADDYAGATLAKPAGVQGVF